MKQPQGSVMANVTDLPLPGAKEKKQDNVCVSPEMG